MDVTIAQIKAGRMLLNWTQEKLADACGFSRPSITRLENGETEPRKSTLVEIKSVMEDAGIEFTERSCIRYKADFLTLFEGEDCYLKLLEDVFLTLRKSRKEVLFLGSDERKSPPEVNESLRRIRKAGIPMRSLIEEGNSFIMGPLVEYRMVKKSLFTANDVTVIYADKLAFLMPDLGVRTVMLIRNKYLAENYRRIFNFIWELSLQPTKTEAKIVY